MFTQRHFEAIAATVRDSLAETGNGFERLTIERLACKLADRFERDNERFNRGRFMRASNVPYHPHVSTVPCGKDCAK